MPRLVPDASSSVVRRRGATGRLGDILKKQGRLNDTGLRRALASQRISGAPLGHVLQSNGIVAGRDVTVALAEQSGRPRIDLETHPPDPSLVMTFDLDAMLAHGLVPWRRTGGGMVFAISAPQDIDAARTCLQKERNGIAFAIADRAQINATIERHRGTELAERTRHRCPFDQSCRAWAGQVGRSPAFVASFAALAILLWLAPAAALLAVMAWVILANTATTALRTYAFIQSFLGQTHEPAGRMPKPEQLPTVSILIPLLKEEIVLRDLIAALSRTTYPKELLDVILVLEADDFATPIALSRLNLPPWLRTLRTPMDTLKTKPRAMNYALEFCRGTVVGIYDAEDRPDPDQIEKIVAHLAAAPPDVAAVQGYLDFYNSRQNWLSRCFTVEYAIWFRVLMQGVARLGFPVPLGGTTVFFRRNILEDVGAWDSHNVTEDADLGMRLARMGYRTEMVATTTMEEANCLPWAWVHQRSRWLKGYAMTWWTHMRQPRRLWRDLGPRGWVGFQLILLAGLSAYLSAPLFWLFWGLTFGLQLPLLDIAPAWVWGTFLASVATTQMLMLAIALRAVWHPARRHLLWVVPTLGLYWPLGALAAYKAMIEVVTRPFHWSKTTHGL